MNSSVNGSARPNFYYGYVIVFVSFIFMMTSVGLFYSFGVFLKPVLEEFGWTRAATAGTFSLALLLAGAMEIPAGKLTDKFGPRYLLTISALLMGLGYWLMSQVNTIWELYLYFGILYGVGLSGTFVPIFATVARWFHARRGLMTGVVGAGVGSGIILFPLVADWLIRNYGWRAAVTSIGLTCLVIMIIGAQFLRKDPSGYMAIPVKEFPSRPGENRSGPTFLEALKTRNLWMSWITYFCIGFAIYTFLSHIVIYATGLNLSDSASAMILSIIGAMSIVGRIGFGTASDKIGSRTSLIVGVSLLTAAILGLLFLRDIWMLYIFGVLFGLAYGAAMGLESLVVAEFLGLKSLGALFGFVDSGATVGGFAGPILAGYIFDITGSYTLAFSICLAVAILSLISTIILRRNPQKELTQVS